MASSEYQKRQDGDNTVFEVTPASAPWNTIALQMVLAWGVVCGWAAYGNDLAKIGNIVVVITVIIIPLCIKDRRPKAERLKSIFRVSPTSIEKNGLVFKKEDIHRLILKNAAREKYYDSIVGSTGDGVAAYAQGQYRTKLAKVGNSLQLEAGGKPYLLAGGMSETTAYGLMTDVGRIIGLQ